MQIPIQRLTAAWEHLLAEALEQLEAFEQASTSGHPLAGVLEQLEAHRLWKAIDRLDRFAVLLIAQPKSLRTWGVNWQQWLSDQLDALHARADLLLARVLPEGEIMVQRFATRMSARDPLALVRGAA